jgi:hypothetical protein
MECGSVGVVSVVLLVAPVVGPAAVAAVRFSVGVGVRSVACVLVLVLVLGGCWRRHLLF